MKTDIERVSTLSARITPAKKRRVMALLAARGDTVQAFFTRCVDVLLASAGQNDERGDL